MAPSHGILPACGCWWATESSYFGYGLVSGHFRRNLLPLWPNEILRDARKAARLRLRHRSGEYNAVQRLAYVAVLMLGVLAIASGLALWKPVQLAALTTVFGGYEVARRIHFAVMAGIVLFILLHLFLVLLGSAHFAEHGDRTHSADCRLQGDIPMKLGVPIRLDEHRPVLRRAERRLLLKGGLSVGALTMLTGCNLQDGDAVDRILWAMSRWNDRVQA